MANSNKTEDDEIEKGKTMINNKTDKADTKALMNDNLPKFELPYLNEPLVDKISLNIPIQWNHHQNHIVDSCMNPNEFPYPGVSKISGKGYMLNIVVHYPDENGKYISKSPIFLQIKPFNKKSAFLRLEYNPAKVTPVHYMHFLKFCHERLDLDLPNALKKAWVSRLDVCMDIFNVDMEGIAILAGHKRRARTLFGSDGCIETVYLGSSTGNQVKLYDKAKQQKKSGKHIRCEVSLRFAKKKLMMGKLEDLDNPFLDISIYDLSAKVSPALLIAVDLFKDSCRYRGIKNALKILKPKNKKLYMDLSKAFKESPVDWWQPEEFWGEHWMNCLEEAGLLPDAAFTSIAPLVHNTESPYAALP